MSKTGSRLAIAAGVFILILAIGAGVLLGQLGRLIERGVETVGPTITGTSVTLDDADISVFSGEGALQDLQIANPEGFSTPYAFDLGRIAVAVDTKTVTADVVHIRSVVIDGPKLVAEFDAQGRNNLKTILDHVRALAAKPGKKASNDESSSGAQKKLIIDEFRFVNAELRAVAVPFKLDKTLKLRAIELNNLGAKQGGAAASDLANQILRPIVDAAIKAARDEYVDAQRDKLEQKAKDKSRDLLDKMLN